MDHKLKAQTLRVELVQCSTTSAHTLSTQEMVEQFLAED